MLSWSEISLYLNYADVNWISSKFGSSKTRQLPTLPGKLWPNYGRCFLGSSSPTQVMCRGPPLSGPVTLQFLFVGVPQRKSVCRQTMRYSSVAKCKWEGIARHTSPNVSAGDDQLLSEAERVRPKQGSSFKRRYFSCLTIFFKYSYGILKLQHLLYLLKKYKSFFHENWLCTTSFKTVRFHWRTLYNKNPNRRVLKGHCPLNPVTKMPNSLHMHLASAVFFLHSQTVQEKCLCIHSYIGPYLCNRILHWDL